MSDWLEMDDKHQELMPTVSAPKAWVFLHSAGCSVMTLLDILLRNFAGKEGLARKAAVAA